MLFVQPIFTDANKASPVQKLILPRWQAEGIFL